MEKYFNRKRNISTEDLGLVSSKDKRLKQEGVNNESVLAEGSSKLSLSPWQSVTNETQCSSACQSGVRRRDVSFSLSYSLDVLVKHERPSEGLDVHYYPNFLRSHKKCFGLLEKELESFFDLSPSVVKVFGKTHKIPRRQTAFGDPGTSYSFSGTTLSANPWIPRIKGLKEIVEMAAEQTFNFVLVNYYRNGLDHMGEHRDDERELCPLSSIASLSLGQERDFVFRHKDARGRSGHTQLMPLKICLTGGSLLLMRPPTNNFWYHSLPIRKKAKGARINLTFRKMRTLPIDHCEPHV